MHLSEIRQRAKTLHHEVHLLMQELSWKDATDLQDVVKDELHQAKRHLEAAINYLKAI